MAKEKVDAGMIFERHEQKFIVEPDKYQKLMNRLEPYMERDKYGLHTICSLYLDTEDYSIIRHSLDKPNFKEKLRLRSYGIPGGNDTVYLELKKKLSGVTYKRRMSMPLWQAKDYLERGIKPPESVRDEQTFGEIDWFMKRRSPVPKVLISYDRIALYGRENGDFRMTFDANVRWRARRLDLGQGDYGNLLFSPGIRLLEVKTLGVLPLWLCGILSELEIYPQSISKYGSVYTEHLMRAYTEVAHIA